MSNLRSVTEASFDADVIANSRPVLVDFWAEWCGPCKALGPTLEKVSENFKGQVDFVKVNVDEHASVRNRFSVKGIPTLILLKGGEEIGRVVGNRSAVQLASFLDAHLGTSTELVRVAITLRAFGGDPQVKAAQTARLQAHLTRKQATPDESMWEGQISSALRFVANTADPDDCARVLGIPTDVVSIVETLSTYRGTHLKAALYVARWLESVPVGANLSKLPDQLLVHLLKNQMVTDLLDGDASLLGVRDELVSLHSAVASGAAPEDESWAKVKKACAEIASNLDDKHRSRLATMLQSASMPLSKDPDVLSGVVFAVGLSVWKQLQDACNWVREDDARVAQLAEEIGKRAEEQGTEPPRGDAMMEKIGEIDPDLASRFRSHYHEGTRALGERGRAIGDMLVDLTAHVV
ncbi:thioredoxin [Trinickia dinghuensis]|uniref:Thioredoxin n=1 Tax=Trinickia dinghuensis TaxID=2291023 RepID=A0A3D8JQF1_9BURK|nr:thioredoxin [Trinickia dinghuensis]RDU95130.1 thioredoxin [Trinickia dinghuensis]